MLVNSKQWTPGKVFFENSKYKFKTEIYLFLCNLMEGFNVLFID